MNADRLWAALTGDNRPDPRPATVLRGPVPDRPTVPPATDDFAPEPAALNARSELVERLYAYFGIDPVLRPQVDATGRRVLDENGHHIYVPERTEQVRLDLLTDALVDAFTRSAELSRIAGRLRAMVRQDRDRAAALAAIAEDGARDAARAAVMSDRGMVYDAGGLDELEGVLERPNLRRHRRARHRTSTDIDTEEFS